MSPFAVLAHSLALALIAAAIELVVLAWDTSVGGRMMMASWQILWVTPVASVFTFLPLALCLAAAMRVAPRLVTSRIVIFATTAATVFAVTFLFHPRLHLIAGATLSAGIAVQTARMSRTRTDAFIRRTRRLAVVIGLAAIAAGISLNVARALAKPAPATAQAGVPNVLLLVLDTVRAPSLSAYGYGRATSPELQRFAARGATFLRAIAPSSWTLPSHASMFTGHYPHELTADWEAPLDATFPTLAGELGRRGYATGGFVANVAYASRETGLDRGFSHYEDYLVAPTDLLIASSLGRFVTNNPRLRRMLGFYDIPGRKRASDLRASLATWLERIGNRPFFAFLNFYDAHEPYLPPPPFDMAFGPVRPRQLSKIRMLNARMAERSNKWEMSTEEAIEEQRAYDQSIAYLDEQLGKLFDGLDRENRLRNTLVVITSDHGEMFGEHGLFSHGNGLHLPTLHVPLIIVYPPKVRAGLRIDTAVTLRDLPATIADLALDDRTLFPGQSLARMAEGAPTRSPVLSSIEPTPTHDPRLPIAKGPMRSLMLEGYHYIRNGDGREELYDLKADLAETADLSARIEEQDRLERFRTTLAEAGAAVP